MDLARDFPGFQQEISAAIINTIRSTTRVAAEDIAFHRTSSAAAARSIDVQNSRLLSLAAQLLRRAVADFHNPLTSLDSLEAGWSTIVDAVDNLLERSDTCLDEFSGRFKQQNTLKQVDSFAQRSRPPRKSLPERATEVPKPQLNFECTPDNHASPPFRPLLATKPHAIVPLDQSLDIREDEIGVQHTQHPYEAEIENYHYPSIVYTSCNPIPFRPFGDSEATLVEDYDGLLEMLEELKTAKEIAIDLEHHDAHSYVGLVSLMQISTRQHDWIIDTLKPWRRKLVILNEVFANPNILKILHGAHMDIIWLQRDFGLYIVGLFDTHHASRVLGYTGGSLAFLLKKFIDFDAQKQYQTADWRLRPLPREMLEYARSDTHFLLYIFDNMRNDLVARSNFNAVEGDLIQRVLDKSRETALQIYEHPHYDLDQGLGKAGWFSVIQKNMSPMSKEQFAVFRTVHQWRDNVARQEDEGIPAIMPNHVLMSIARALPRDIPSLLNVSHPISQALRLRGDELLQLIRSTLSSSVSQPTLAEKLTEIMQLRPGLARRAGVALQAPSAVVASKPKPETRAIAADIGSDVRASLSSFWGPTVEGSTIALAPTSIVAAASGRMALPVPPYSMSALSASSVQAADEYVEETAVVGDLNGLSPASALKPQAHPEKRKFDETPSIMVAVPVVGTNSLEPSAMDQQPVAEAELTVTAAAKRARKALRKDAAAGQSVSGEDNANTGEQQPFDYGAASSVLHAPRPTHGFSPAGRPFNPYAKAADAPSGLRKKQDSRATRSATFKQ